MEKTIVSVDWQQIAAERQIQIDYLEKELDKAQRNRMKYELKYQELLDEIESGKYKKVLTKEEREGEKDKKNAEKQQRMLTGVNVNGRKLASASEAIGSYTDFKRVYDWLLNNTTGGLRNATMWMVGCNLGVRASDIVRLKFYHFFDNNFQYRERIPVLEKKTAKLNNAYITEAIKLAIDKYVEATYPEGLILTDYVFQGRIPGEHITEKAFYKFLAAAQKALDISVHLGTHSMRKSFVKIIECTYDATINEKNLAVIQTLLNHESSTTTSRYLGVMKSQCDGARKAVSDFTLGKWDGDELVSPKIVSNNELYDLLMKAKNEIINEINK